MANITTIEKIATGITPTDDENASIESSNLVSKRMGAAPLDTTEIFFDKTAAENYANESSTAKWQHGSKSYVGQHISVVDKTNGTVDMYQIQNTAGDLKKILAEPLKGQEFDFDQYTLSEVLKQVIIALGGTVKQTPTPEA